MVRLSEELENLFFNFSYTPFEAMIYMSNCVSLLDHLNSVACPSVPAGQPFRAVLSPAGHRGGQGAVQGRQQALPRQRLQQLQVAA